MTHHQWVVPVMREPNVYDFESPADIVFDTLKVTETEDYAHHMVRFTGKQEFLGRCIKAEMFVTKELMEDSVFDIKNYVAKQLRQKIAEMEDQIAGEVDGQRAYDEACREEKK